MRRTFLALCLCLASLPAHADRAALMKLHRGGTLHLAASAAAGTIDPAVNYEEEFNEVFAATQDELVTFRKVAGPAGTDIVPDLAESVPEPQDGGTTYVFKLRHGLYFSTGAEIKVADVVATFQRMFKVLGPNIGSWYSVIVGADACLKQPATCTLAGGLIGDEAAGTITFHLTHPDAEFFDQLAMPFAAILPADTPARDLGTRPPPATGAYMIASYDPVRELRLVRNPYFHEWSADAQPDGYPDIISYRYGLEDEAQLTEVENGSLDWMYDEKPLDRLSEIGTKYPRLAHIDPLLAYYYITMNVNQKPFDQLLARQAVAFAVNRRATINLYGGPALGTPICQLLPAGMPGYQPYCPYSKPPGPTWTAPDLAHARDLVRQSGTAGMKVTMITSDKQVERTIGIYLQSLLNDIGYQASVRTVSFNIRDSYMENSNNHYQIGLTDWYLDYPAPGDFLDVMFSCKSIHPGSDASINMSQYCDPAVEAEMDRANILGATDMPAALSLWTKIDHQITDAAPGASLFQVNFLDIVSPRLGNFQFHTLYHLLFSQAWVQ